MHRCQFRYMKECCIVTPLLQYSVNHLKWFPGQLSKTWLRYTGTSSHIHCDDVEKRVSNISWVVYLEVYTFKSGEGNQRKIGVCKGLCHYSSLCCDSTKSCNWGTMTGKRVNLMVRIEVVSRLVCCNTKVYSCHIRVHVNHCFVPCTQCQILLCWEWT